MVEDIRSLDRQRHLAFSTEMDRLGALRVELAHSLTDAFTHVERTAGVFLIKPVYAPRGSRNQGSLITPISRPLPSRKPLVAPPASRPRTGTASAAVSARSTPGPHPKMRLVSSLLLHSRQGHRGETRESIGEEKVQTISLYSNYVNMPSFHTFRYSKHQWAWHTPSTADWGRGRLYRWGVECGVVKDAGCRRLSPPSSLVYSKDGGVGGLEEPAGGLSPGPPPPPLTPSQTSTTSGTLTG